MISFNQSSPSYDIVCPGDTLVFTCITSYSYNQGIVSWQINNQIRLLIINSGISQDAWMGFILNITDTNNNAITSTATSESVLNGTVVKCSGYPANFGNKSLTVHIAGKIHHVT